MTGISDAEPEEKRGVSRRGLLGLVGAGAAGLVVGAGAGSQAAWQLAVPPPALLQRTVLRLGIHSSVSTKRVSLPQCKTTCILPRSTLMARTSREDPISLLQDWSYAASRHPRVPTSVPAARWMVHRMRLQTIPARRCPLAANGLTITFGFGPSCLRTKTVIATRSRPTAKCARQVAGVSRR